MERNVGERKGNETQNRARNKRELIKRVKDTRDGYTKRGKKEKKIEYTTQRNRVK